MNHEIPSPLGVAFGDNGLVPPRHRRRDREATARSMRQAEAVAAWRYGFLCGALSGAIAGALLVAGAIRLGFIVGGLAP